MTREQQIQKGKIWTVYPDIAPDDVIFEGSRAACMKFVREHGFERQRKKGTIRVGQVIWEK